MKNFNEISFEEKCDFMDDIIREGLGYPNCGICVYNTIKEILTFVGKDIKSLDDSYIFNVIYRNFDKDCSYGTIENFYKSIMN